MGGGPLRPGVSSNFIILMDYNADAALWQVCPLSLTFIIFIILLHLIHLFDRVIIVISS